MATGQHDGDEGSRNESSEALIISSKEQDRKRENQTIASVESDEKHNHANSIPDVPSAADEKDPTQKQILEEKGKPSVNFIVLLFLWHFTKVKASI
ncbi:hypothetical protein DsansV1_C03g0029841 [Dioscorea sansibarensis]